MVQPEEGIFSGPRKGEGVTFALVADRPEAHNSYRYVRVGFFVRGAGGEAGGGSTPCELHPCFEYHRSNRRQIINQIIR